MILLTVPHSGRGGDASALVCSRTIADRLAKQHGMSAVTVQAGLPRSLVDMNRPNAADTSWRRSINVLVNSVKIGVHLDIHSFPPGIPELRDAQVAIVVAHESVSPLVGSMLGCLGAVTQRVLLLVRPEITEITDSVASMGCPSAMLEFSDQIPSTTKRLLCNAAADCAASFADETVNGPPRSFGSRITVSRVYKAKERRSIILCGTCNAPLRDPSALPCRRCLKVSFCCSGCRRRHECHKKNV